MVICCSENTCHQIATSTSMHGSLPTGPPGKLVRIQPTITPQTHTASHPQPNLPHSHTLNFSTPRTLPPSPNTHTTPSPPHHYKRIRVRVGVGLSARQACARMATHRSKLHSGMWCFRIVVGEDLIIVVGFVPYRRPLSSNDSESMSIQFKTEATQSLSKFPKPPRNFLLPFFLLPSSFFLLPPSSFLLPPSFLYSSRPRPRSRRCPRQLLA